MAFRRFAARRGRCATVYCDNGTNFIAAANYFKQLNGSQIQKYGAINSIEWKFNPQLLLGGADVGADNKKRIIRPLGCITEIIPGKDGQVRLVRVQTSQQEFLRPIQSIYPLEISSSDNVYAPMIPDDLKKIK
ncbi:DUF5641 domain-containing protein [Trichonephila clavipes]|nr:DUF5641 domain-containing protein [Trichonephila clavipes]